MVYKGIISLSDVQSSTYTAAKRANAVERVKLEREWSVLEKQYRRARREVIARREEAREELRQFRLEMKGNLNHSIELWDTPGQSLGPGRRTVDSAYHGASLDFGGNEENTDLEDDEGQQRIRKRKREKLEKRFYDQHFYSRKRYGEMVSAILTRPPALVPLDRVPDDNLPPTEKDSLVTSESSTEKAILLPVPSIKVTEEGNDDQNTTHTTFLSLLTKQDNLIDTMTKQSEQTTMFPSKYSSPSERTSRRGSINDEVSLKADVVSEDTMVMPVLKLPECSRRSSIISAATSNEGNKSTKSVTFNHTLDAPETDNPQPAVASLNEHLIRRRESLPFLVPPQQHFSKKLNDIPADFCPPTTHRRASLVLPDVSVAGSSVNTPGSPRNDVTSGLTSFQGVTSYNGVTQSVHGVTAYQGVTRSSGWKKVQKFMGAIRSVNPEGPAKAVDERLKMRRNSSFKLLLVLEELNKRRTTAELLEMDKVRRKLQETDGESDLPGDTEQ